MKNTYSELIANTIMDRFPDPDSFPYRSWTYSQAFMLWGFARLYEKTNDKKYLDYIMSYCDKHVKENGDVPGFKGDSLDDILPGSILLWAYKVTKKEKYRIACETVRRNYDDYPRNSNGGFWHARWRNHEMWVDGLFMGLMFLTRYGKYIGDKEYCYKETVDQLRIGYECCEKDGSGLLYHAYSEDLEVFWAHPITGKSPEIWSEGLGWYAMALVEVLSLLPKDYPGYDQVLLQLQKLAKGLAKVQDSSCGLWYQVVDKPTHPRNFHDTSGSAMFAYTLKKAVDLNLLDSNEYNEEIQKAYTGIKSKCAVDLDGHINIYDACDGVCVQQDYAHYVDYMKNVNAKECVAAVLWAMVEMEYGVSEG